MAGMNAKQKRAYNRAAKALTELGEATMEDNGAFNAAAELVARALGALIGTTAAAHMLPFADLHAATETAARHVQKHAAESYGKYLAVDRALHGDDA